MNGLRKPFRKKSDKIKKNRKSMSKSKQKARPRMNSEWIVKRFRKKSNPKNRKTLKIKVNLPHVNKNQRESEILFKHRFLTLL